MTQMPAPLSDHTIALLYIPCPSPEAAEALAALLLEQKLIACANLVPGMVSLYRWEGTTAREPETVLVAKTDTAHLDAARAAAESAHPYDCPCILTLPAEANAAFAAWVAGEGGNGG